MYAFYEDSIEKWYVWPGTTEDDCEWDEDDE